MRWTTRLAPGYCAAATHGVLRVGHAARALTHGETPLRVRELGDAFASWAANYQTLPIGVAKESPHPVREATRRGAPRARRRARLHGHDRVVARRAGSLRAVRRRDRSTRRRASGRAAALRADRGLRARVPRQRARLPDDDRVRARRHVDRDVARDRAVSRRRTTYAPRRATRGSRAARSSRRSGRGARSSARSRRRASRPSRSSSARSRATTTTRSSSPRRACARHAIAPSPAYLAAASHAVTDAQPPDFLTVQPSLASSATSRSR